MNKSESIAIIGAGPAGLSIAKILRDRGYKTTIYEQAGRPGGKVDSLFREGAWREMGACYLTSGYTRLSKWMEADGYTFKTLDSYVRDELGETITFNEYVYGDNPWKVRIQVAKYLIPLAVFRVKKALGWLNEEDYRELAAPFGPWLLERNLDAVHRIAKRSTVAMGYGFLDETPLLWGFSWNIPSLFLTGLTEGPRQVVDGWLRYWIELSTKLDIHYGHQVQFLRRCKDHVGIYAKTYDKRMIYVEYDHVINTLPFGVIGEWRNATKTEKWLASHSESTPYATTLCRVSGWFKEPLIAYSDRLNGPPHHRLLVARSTDEEDWESTKPKSFVCYQYAPPGKPEEVYGLLEAQLALDIKGEGGSLEEIIERRVWSYFPRYTKEGIAKGAPGRLEEVQGENNVWYTGANASLESIDHIIDFNAVLADKIVARIEGHEDWWQRGCQILKKLSYHTW